MKLIEADKVEQAIKDYWEAQVDKALTLTDGNEKRINIYLEHNHELLKAIDELPSAQPERKTGRWIHLSRHKWIRTHKCDQCGNILDFDGVNAGRGDANFCPNCGADMRGEQE